MCVTPKFGSKYSTEGKKNVTHTATLNNHKNRLPNNLTTNPNAAASTRRIDDTWTRNAIATYDPIQQFP